MSETPKSIYDTLKIKARLNPEKIDNTLETFFSNVWIYVRSLMINLIVFILVFYVFTVPDQAIDILNGIVSDGIVAIFWFWLGITLLSLSLWYSSIFALAFHDLSRLRPNTDKDKDEYGNPKDIHDKIIEYLPYIFGIGIYLVICLAFEKQGVANSFIGWFYLGVGIVLGVILFQVRRRVMKEKKMKHLISKPSITWPEDEDYSMNLDKRIIKILTYIILIVITFSLGISFIPLKPAFIPQAVYSGAIICFYFTGAVVLFNVLWAKVKHQYFKLSLPVFILIIIPFFTLFNNNHDLRLEKESGVTRSHIVDDYKGWLAQRMDPSQYSSQKKFPIYLVAAEGGGIRSMKWTGMVLDQLYKGHESFSNNLYAISGVSGGSVGSIFQQAALSIETPSSDITTHSQKLEGAISEDFLAPVTFGLLLPDMIQSIIPVPIHAWDRARWLEDAWHYSFKKQFETNVLNQTINQYWSQKNPRLAHIFLNCTSLETGQKAVISNLSLDKKYFGSTIDLGTEIHKANPGMGIPLKSAASLSARFPLVTSAGKVELLNGSCQFVDGGYHDNTGLETLSQIVNMMIQETEDSLLEKIKFSIILIKNSEDKNYSEVKSKDFIVDVAAPLSTLLSHWGNGTKNKVDNTTSLFNTFTKLNLDIELFKFQLDRDVFFDRKDKDIQAYRYLDEQDKVRFRDINGKERKKSELREIVLPLGWYLSKSADEEIQRQVNLITTPGNDSLAMENSRVYQSILSQLQD